MLKLGWGTVNLEARAAGSPYNWSFTGTATQEQAPMPVPRGKVLGGSSAINGQTFIRGAPEDFDTWASWGNDGWGYLDCLPYFRRLENDADFHDDFHGTDGPVPVRHHPRETWPVVQEAFFQAATAAGYPYNPDVNHPEATGISQRAENNIEGVRMSMALAYINPVRHRLNLTIRPNVQARRVALEEGTDGKRAVGVEVESGGDRFVVEGDDIILCAGAVASPQLLMLSGIGPAGQLAAQGIPVAVELPGVGQNMRDHTNVSVRFSVKEGTPEDPDAMRAVRLRYTATGKGELRLESDDPQNCAQHGLSLLEEDWDRERLRECVRRCVSLLQHSAYDRFIQEITAPYAGRPGERRRSDLWLTAQHQHLVPHFRATCKMGPENDPMAVVDPQLRVRGVSNLRVAMLR
ncbi:Uncharacterized GMC-type oxidoreductase in thcA 5'region [Geodia barretti]|uniref:Uncharacterized GMC-type oxidoreductase in thcA 5'region n=1 Tax=Geodia barretti TaxID=519541 RepID=A0AA35X9H8_GEOBA|nr:Uncharacterized GMC-type oxidoreductase in thcA 5'region [Geodia barretti]